MNWDVNSCFHVSALWLLSTDGNAPTANDIWAANCWATMGMWLSNNPDVTDEVADMHWNDICQRSWGDEFNNYKRRSS